MQVTKNTMAPTNQHFVTVSKVQTQGGVWHSAISKGAAVVGGHQVKIWMWGVWLDVRTATNMVSKSHDWRTTWRCPPDACQPGGLPPSDGPLFGGLKEYRRETTPLAKLLLEL